MTLNFEQMKEILAWASENGVKSIEIDSLKCHFGADEKSALSGEDLKGMLDKDGNLSAEEYEEILYHSARA